MCMFSNTWRFKPLFLAWFKDRYLLILICIPHIQCAVFTPAQHSLSPQGLFSTSGVKQWHKFLNHNQQEKELRKQMVGTSQLYL